MEEIRRAKELWPQVKEFFFDDDTFTDDLPRAEAIAEGLGKLGVTWSCNAKANVPRATLEKLKAGGLRLLLVGYESGDQQILHNIKKGMLIPVAEKFTQDCHDLGIQIHGTFIVGLPGETLETLEATKAWARKINPHTIQVSLAAPYPGTFLYDQAVENGWLDASNADELINDKGIQIAPLHYPGVLTHDEIFHSVEDFYKKFYFRPSKIGSIVKENGHRLRHDEAAPARRRGVRRLPERTQAGGSRLKQLIVTADDFGAAVEVNEAVEEAARKGVLRAASLMVAAPACADAVTRAKRAAGLHVGLHLVLVEGRPLSPARELPDLVTSEGFFRTDMARMGADIFFRPAVRRKLASGDRGAVRRLSLQDWAPSGSRQHAQALPSAPDHRRSDPEDWPAFRPESQPGADRASRHPRRRRSRRCAAARLCHRALGSGGAGALSRGGHRDGGSGVRPGLVRRHDSDARGWPHPPDAAGAERALHPPATTGGFEGAAPGYRYAEELQALLSSETAEAVKESGAHLGAFSDFD